jgi:hypothetical protein
VLFIVEHFSYFFGMLNGVILGKWKNPAGKASLFYHEIVSFKASSKLDNSASKSTLVST